jgi:hypothetical protein
MLALALRLQDVQEGRKQRGGSDVAEHVVLDAPLHGDWLAVFVLDSGCAAVAGVFLHSQLKFCVELGLRLHLLLGGLDMVYICAGVWLAFGLDRRLLQG